jgi:hypothetical protein
VDATIVVAAALAISVVRNIQRRQDQSAEMLASAPTASAA